MDGYSPGLRAAKTYLETRIGGGQGWLDMRVHSCRDAELVVAMGVDLTYRHEAALVFKEPFFFSGPFSWTAPSTGARALHRLTAAERATLNHPEVRQPEGHFFAIDADDGPPILVGADDIELDETPVYYYKLENLTRDEP